MAGAYFNIGLVEHRKHEYEKAQTYYLKALEIQLAVNGENHRFTAAIYNNIGSNLCSEEKYPQALTYLEKSLLIKKMLKKSLIQ